MSPVAAWPKGRLHPAPLYSYCWRCGIDMTPGPTQRACIDCRPVVKIERNLWKKP